MFDDRFEAILADTESARRIHYKIRYQVYCLEEMFEDYKKFPDGEERDEWDENAIHFLVRSKITKEWVSAMRIVLPSSKGFPLERLCEIDPVLNSCAMGNSVVEISRLCIQGDYRRTVQRQTVPTGSAVEKYPYLVPAAPEAAIIERWHKSEIVMGLMRAAAAYCYRHQIDNWYFLSTPAFARMMNRLSFQLVKLGPTCNHRGKRIPFLINHLNAYEKAKHGCSAMAAFLRRPSAYRNFSELGLPMVSQPYPSLVA